MESDGGEPIDEEAADEEESAYARRYVHQNTGM